MSLNEELQRLPGVPVVKNLCFHQGAWVLSLARELTKLLYATKCNQRIKINEPMRTSLNEQCQMILCLLNGYICILLFRSGHSNMKGPVNALRRGLPPSLQVGRLRKPEREWLNEAQLSRLSDVGPGSPATSACTWQAPARPQEDPCGATPDTGIRNRQAQGGGPCSEGPRTRFLSSWFLEASHCKYVTLQTVFQKQPCKDSIFYSFLIIMLETVHLNIVDLN